MERSESLLLGGDISDAIVSALKVEIPDMVRSRLCS